jgi:hypothetical protein
VPNTVAVSSDENYTQNYAQKLGAKNVDEI